MKSLLTTSACILALIASLICTDNCHADTLLPDGSWGNNASYVCAGATGCSQGYTFISGGGTVSETATYSYNGTTSTATAVGTILPNASPSLSVTATTTGSESNTALESAFAQSTLDYVYSMKLTGPSGSVPILYNAYGSVSAAGALANFAVAELFITWASGGPTVVEANAANPSFTLSSQQHSVAVGDVIQIEMLVTTASDVASPSQSATLDPYFILSTEYQNAGYGLEFSPNVGNGPVSSTPLPAALPLFTLGLGALGLLGWRRKRKAQATA